MTSTPDPSFDPQQVQVLQLLQLALTTAPVLFLIVVAALPAPTPTGDVGLEQMQLFSAVHVFMALGCVAAAMVVPTMIQGRMLDQGAPLLAVFRQALILRMALLEGAALFGGAIVFLAKNSGALAEQPLLWVNAGSTLALVVLSLLTFPTLGRLEQAARDRTSAP